MGKKKEDVDEKYLIDCLKDPMLLSRVVLDGLDEIIVGEDDARRVIFMCAIGSLVLNNCGTSYNLLVNSESGAGKDYLVSNVLKIFPDDMVLKRTRISPTALTYWHNSKFEPKWSWDGKILYLEDVSNAILNCDVFKVFTSGGSYATIVRDQMAIDIKINGKPVVIITSASANPEPEIVRRFIVVNLDESKQQTKDVMQKWCDYAKKGKKPKLNNDYAKALKYLCPYNVKIEWAKKILKFFPHDHIIMRTAFSRFLDFVKASAVLHQYAREKDVDGFLIAEKQDYDIAREVVLATASNEQMIPLTRSQKEIMTAMKELGCKIVRNETLNIEEEVGWTHHEICGKIPLSSSEIYKQITKLVSMGFIEKRTHKFEYDNKHTMVYKVKEFQKLYIPEWEKLEN